MPPNLRTRNAAIHPVVDAGLAVALAVAITIQIRVAPGPGAQPDVFAYACGLIIAALTLARRRWPLAVLLASVATLQVYYLSNYTSICPAVPLSVALATAWAAGHRRWSLLIAAWYVVGPLAYSVFQLSAPTEPPLTVVGEAVSNTAMFAAVLVLGEAVRSRRALALEQERSERLLLNVLPASIATRLQAGEAVIADACALPLLAGPVEATALGNVLVQARAAGRIDGGLETMRALLRDTQEVRRHQPAAG